MEPQEALNILDQVAASVPANRATHVQIQQAIGALQELVNSNKAQKENAKPKK